MARDRYVMREEFDNNCVINAMFADFTGPTLDDWTIVTITVTKETSITKIGGTCAKLDISATGSVYQDIANFAKFKGKTVRLSQWMKVSVSGKVKIFVDDGLTTTYSEAHPGTGWVLVEVVKVVSASATKVRVGTEVVATDSSYAYLSETTLTNWNYDD